MRLGNSEEYINADVLVVGGGMAGFFAAIKAKEQGLSVILADKGYPGKTGATHYAEGDIVFFRPERGHKMKEWLDIISKRCEYINNREWDEICLRESEDTYKDLIAWGIPFYEKDGKYYTISKQPPWEVICMEHRKYSPALRHKAIDVGVIVLDKIVICRLLKQEGRITGAIGFNTISGNLYIFNVKAVIIATGNSSLKSGGYPTEFWTGDGDFMAYKAGAELADKEFAGPLSMGGRPRSLLSENKQDSENLGITGEVYDNSYRYPFAITGNWTGWYDMPSLNAEGKPVTTPAWEAHMGRIPLYHDWDTLIASDPPFFQDFFLSRIGEFQGAKIGLDPFRGGKLKWPPSRMKTYSIMGGGSGIWPVDTSCSSGVPGLYAAGNSCATKVSGAIYGGMGMGINHAAVTGTHAALGAAEYIRQLKVVKLDQSEVDTVKAAVCAPMLRTGGFSPAWVTQVLQGFMFPYFILYMKHESRLKPALSLVEFVNKHLVPMMKVNDAHEWRLAQETEHMALMAEMILKASLFRTESRGIHFREDYPRRDDPTWLAWTKVREENGEITLYKQPVPKEWWPDLSTPYEERYPSALPLE